MLSVLPYVALSRLYTFDRFFVVSLLLTLACNALPSAPNADGWRCRRTSDSCLNESTPCTDTIRCSYPFRSRRDFPATEWLPQGGRRRPTATRRPRWVEHSWCECGEGEDFAEVVSPSDGHGLLTYADVRKPLLKMRMINNRLSSIAARVFYVSHIATGVRFNCMVERAFLSYSCILLREIISCLVCIGVRPINDRERVRIRWPTCNFYYCIIGQDDNTIFKNISSLSIGVNAFSNISLTNFCIIQITQMV